MTGDWLFFAVIKFIDNVR